MSDRLDGIAAAYAEHARVYGPTRFWIYALGVLALLLIFPSARAAVALLRPATQTELLAAIGVAAAVPVTAYLFAGQLILQRLRRRRLELEARLALITQSPPPRA